MLRTLPRIVADRFKQMLHVRRTLRKSVLSQFSEIIRLRLGEGKVGSSEYYNYELYDDRLFTFAAKRDFIGEHARVNFYDGFNSRDWRAIADDKIAFYTFMQGLGLRVPRLYGLYSPSHRFLNGVPCITNPGALAMFILKKLPTPFFAKPVCGVLGRGAFAVQSIDRDIVQFRSGSQIEIDEFVAKIVGRQENGYLFQECLAPHPSIREISGESLSTLRMVTVLSENGPELLSTIWRIPRGVNMADNFAHGTSGNLIARIDVKTGKAVEVLQHVGMNRIATDCHPDSRKQIVGMILPDWHEAVRLCLATATVLPGLRLQNWDCALSADGPLLMEINFAGDLDLVQYAYRSGFRGLCS
jgi:Sugar-transfer associated ATP-grasp